MKVGRLLLRAAVGSFFIGHGTQKLFGWFGGPGLKGQAEQFEGLGLKPGVVHATAAGAAETLGGAGVLLGYRTPLASAGIVSVMLTAINRVHIKNGPWAHKGGYEYNVVLAAAAVAIAEAGPGILSLDALRGKERSGAKWGLFSLVLGVAGAAGAHVLAESRATPVEVTEPAGTPGASVNGSDPATAPMQEAPAAEVGSEETGSETPSTEV
jgi:putative oxidoreductase